MDELTEKEKMVFEGLMSGWPRDAMCLMRVKYEGKDRSVVCVVMPVEEGADDVQVFPVAMIVDGEMFEKMGELR